MTEQLIFPVDEWSVREIGLNLDALAQTESIFALSNGHIGLRGNLDEGEPHGLPGTYLNSFYELRPLPYAEGGYAYPESGQTAINVTNGKLIRLLVDDEPFDVRYGKIEEHERELDLRDGVLRRSVRWTSPAGNTVKVSSVRMVSLTQPSATRSSHLTPRYVSWCSRNWLLTRHSRPRVRTPGWVPRLSPRSNPRSTWRRATAGC
jgi:alpha,alpha-trehalose phosphorylase